MLVRKVGQKCVLLAGLQSDTALMKENTSSAKHSIQQRHVWLFTQKNYRGI